MGILDWAKSEIDIVMKEENKKDDPSSNYAKDCYESAFKALKSLFEDEHSGFSIIITKNILNRLIDNKPLSPLKGDDTEWDFSYENDKTMFYRNKRMSAFIKKVDKSKGTITLTDIKRSYGKDIYTKAEYTFSLITQVIDELYPISIPYYPTDVFKVETEDFLYDSKNGDFDTIALYSTVFNNQKILINRYFTSSQNFPQEKIVYETWVEITEDKFLEMKNRRAKEDE